MLSVEEMEMTASSKKGFEAAVKTTIRDIGRSQKVVGWDVLSVCCESPREGEVIYRANLKVKILVDR